MNTAPTHLTTMQYARLQQWREELCAIARKALGNPDHPGDLDTLARWAADDIVPDALFYTAPQGHLLHILRGTYQAVVSEAQPRRDTPYERYAFLTHDLETRQRRLRAMLDRKKLTADDWDGLQNIIERRRNGN